MRCSFDTSWGRFAVSWTARGITRLEFPPARGGSDRPPASVRAAISSVRRFLAGEERRLDAPLDFRGVPPFFRRVYRELREVPPGRTITYGGLAARAGKPLAARAVGAAMRRNPVPLFVPCHRVVGAGGALGGFSAPGGARLKRRLLALEGRGGVSS